MKTVFYVNLQICIFYDILFKIHDPCKSQKSQLLCYICVRGFSVNYRLSTHYILNKSD